jgi:acyl-CoA synthetase (NDP forming)
VLGIACVAPPRDLPIAPDLAVVAVPTAQVLDVGRGCGERGARGILLVTAGFGEAGDAGTARQRDVLAVARRYGMRLIGPNCLGLVNTDPKVQLNATFAPMPMDPGGLGLVSQSGALGIAVLAAAQRRGLGISQFVSVGNKADVSGSDLLLAWERDERTSVIALYLESFGNPRKFARLARRVSRTKPLIAIKAGARSPGSARAVAHRRGRVVGLGGRCSVHAGRRAARGVHGADARRGPAHVRAAAAGWAQRRDRRQLGGPGILAADAAEAAGLTVVEFGEATRDLLARAAPFAASYQNPVDLGAGAQPSEVAAAVQVLLDAPDVDAVLTLFTETLVADPAEIMTAIAATATGKPVVAVQVGGGMRRPAACRSSRSRNPRPPRWATPTGMRGSAPPRLASRSGWASSTSTRRRRLWRSSSPPAPTGSARTRWCGCCCTTESRRARNESCPTRMLLRPPLPSWATPSP